MRRLPFSIIDPGVSAKLGSQLVSLGLCIAFIAGCATGKATVVGESRPPCESEKVEVYFQAPPDYEVIALLEASSDATLLEEETAKDFCVAKLKKLAAKHGANGVLVESITRPIHLIVGVAAGMPYVFPEKTMRITGKAIFLPQE